MKMIILLAALSGFAFSSQAGTLFGQLCAFNPNWKNYPEKVPAERERVFLSDKQYIQTHLEFVLSALKSADLSTLTKDQREMRTHLTEVLSDYRLQGVFPVNYNRSERIPVFIDEMDRHCAVGYLMKETGFENLALQISKGDNYIWVKDLSGEEVLKWQSMSGFTLEELKLIQGAYDSYMPFALEQPNRIEIPQKPEVICMNFKQKDLARSSSKTGTDRIWIRGEGKDGVLHGRWEQNYSPTLPWIVGFYQDGEREGKWLEYYQGTNALCRTEHWKDDRLNGIRTRFDRKGDVIEEIQFENGAAVLKTNYELGHSLKFVRKPLGENKVWTEVYNLDGRLIASGHESIHNPGNLQWFQNIELTALNTMSLVSQSYSQTHVNGSANSVGTAVRLYDEPPLVEYIKQGDWVYFVDTSDDYPGARSMGQNWVLFNKRFSRFGADIVLRTNHFGNTQQVPEFDSLRVSYSDGNVTVFNGFYDRNRFRMEFEWYSEQDYIELENHSYFVEQQFHRGGIPISRLQRVKSIGFVNEKDEKIGKWQYFNVFGRLSRVEEFILPEKKK
ncbi:hypothetical protein [Fluviicola sp.]|uniref:toxin-antitoxin system YwqK family antitoxin n=1 Tax=Fluviicola sp. TaxID=1917219 RepID=UPI00261BC31F|nr:hypothetical protein [Fluviicola sp.]